MPTKGVSYLFFWLRSSRLPLLLVLAASGGCTLLVGEKLSDKPSYLTGGAGQGGAGGGDPSTGSQSSSAAQSSAAQSSAAQSSSSTGSGALTCGKNLANCDGDLMNGCEAHLDADNKNCGSCNNPCTDGKHCKGGKCQ